jgi:hypothetical protein
MKIQFSAFILLFICIFSSCSSENKENKDEMEILSVTDSFATKYYTWRFKDAARFSDEEFTRFLRFLSSNVNQKDIDVLTKSAETPGFSVDSVEIKETDLADVTLNLTNIYQMDSLGKEPQLTSKTTQKLILKKNNGKWQVSKIIKVSQASH